jgi:drug/metabolite transporter (DMT)-like permease
MLNVFLFSATVLIWGTTWYAITFQLGEVALEWSLVYRFAAAAIILFVFCLVTKRPLRFTWRHHRVFAALGLLLFSFNYYFSYVAVEHLTSGLVAVVFSLLAIMNIFNGAIFLKRPLEWRMIVVSLVGLFGLALIFWPDLKSFSLGSAAMIGLGTAFLATWSASLGATVAASKAARPLPLIPTNAWGIFYGLILLTVFAASSGIRPGFDTSTPYLISLAFLALFGTVIAFSLYLLLLARAGLERAGYIAVAFPVVALIISSIFEGYQWTLLSLTGVVLVLGGNVVVLRTKPLSAQPPCE